MAEFDIFISYRRVGGFETAKHLYDLLKHDGYTVSFDIDTLREGKFNVALLSRIKLCQDFVLIVDPHTFDRTLDPSFDSEQDWLRQELSYALSLQKNVIPILLAGASFPEGLPDDIREVKYMNGPGYSKDYFDAFYNKLKWLLHSKPRNNTEDILELSEPERIQENRAEIHIETDVDCEVFRFKEKVLDINSGEDNTIYLQRGKHLVTFVSKIIPDVKEQIMLDIPSSDYSDYVSIKLLQRVLDRIHLQRFEQGGKYGYIDKSNQVKIPPIYKVAGEFNEGLASVSKNGWDNGFGYIDKLGREVIPPIYQYAQDFSEGLAAVKKDWYYGFIDRTGKVIIPFIYDEVRPFASGLAPVTKTNWTRDWGYIDKTGKSVTSFQYNSASSFREGLARVERNGKCGFIDNTGREVIPVKYESANEFVEGLAAVKVNGKYGFIDKTDRMVIASVYESATVFSDGLAPVKKDGKYGFIDKSGRVIIPFIYDEAAYFEKGATTLGIKLKGEYIWIDRHGNKKY